MNRLWHCFNCDTDFEAPTNTCTNCKADGNDPRARGVIAPRVVIHFDAPHEILHGRGVGTLACNPGKKVGSQGTRATGDPRVVNCPGCKATEAWRAASLDLEVPPAYRLPVPVTVAPEETAPAQG